MSRHHRNMVPTIMKITNFELKKSRTIGFTDSKGRAQFKKIEFQAEASLDDNDNPVDAYEVLSVFIENMLDTEKKLIINK